MENIFDSRREVEYLMLILQEWLKEHPQDNKAEYANELFDKLDYIYMVW